MSASKGKKKLYPSVGERVRSRTERSRTGTVTTAGRLGSVKVVWDNDAEGVPESVKVENLTAFWDTWELPVPARGECACGRRGRPPALDLQRSAYARERVARGITVPEVASELGIGTSTLYRYLQQEKLRDKNTEES
ncbi:hypothetical protein ACT17_14965 [Mycolicibacterium conceptionense]|uniref:Resolvase HTH domain-containing protein n=1 Tax=Mycolicibacterium conceptionense TaxID=451644 RepID=A0A0J8WX32_9MYCO|nr:helix-turn-helix domain-containing protein [Mycolicibacterium conceptionense]KMV17589.1 hypothetical protein ACT17_14965 [Mycolicibacterium conceptionense]